MGDGRIDIVVGQRFGALLVISPVARSGRGFSCVVKCDHCGAEKKIGTSQLLVGQKQCGCRSGYRNSAKK